MKIYDISQEVFGCEVYPGDRVPKKTKDLRMADGEMYNLTSFEMCAHNGTHIDAPFHFLQDGDTVEKIPLEKMVGYCYVTEQDGEIGGEAAGEVLKAAGRAFEEEVAGGDVAMKNANAGHACMEAAKRILFKGNAVITADAAHVFADAGIYLLGVESQSVGPEDAPMEVHKILLGEKVVLLEGIRLNEVKEGVYFLNAAPISLEGSDGAPCRAILMEL